MRPIVLCGHRCGSRRLFWITILRCHCPRDTLHSVLLGASGHCGPVAMTRPWIMAPHIRSGPVLRASWTLHALRSSAQHSAVLAPGP